MVSIDRVLSMLFSSGVIVYSSYFILPLQSSFMCAYAYIGQLTICYGPTKHVKPDHQFCTVMQRINMQFGMANLKVLPLKNTIKLIYRLFIPMGMASKSLLAMSS